MFPTRYRYRLENTWNIKSNQIMANAIQRAHFYDYLAIVNANAVQRTSWWDYLPTEIQIYIIQLAIRQQHRDQLAEVHQILEKLWRICRCGPVHVLKEYNYIKKRKWKVTCGIVRSLGLQNCRLPASWALKTLGCRKEEEDED